MQTSQDRELPQPPPSSEVASSSQRNSADVVIEISKDAASGGESRLAIAWYAAYFTLFIW